MFRTNFLSDIQIEELAEEHGTPLYVYSKEKIIEQAIKFLSVPAPYGLTIRYAMKANPNPEILKILNNQRIKIDASSEYEAQEAIEAGYSPKDVLLTSQQFAADLITLIDSGITFHAGSLYQLEQFGKLLPGREVGVRINPGIGSGFSNKVNTGGITSSFGVWHEYIPRIHKISEKYNLKINRIHTHIGAGTDPEVWGEALKISLGLIKHFPDADTLDFGGGFKVGRMDDERDADIDAIGEILAQELTEFYHSTGRKLKLELEPGHLMVGNTGTLIASVEDVVDTGPDGYSFIKLNTGMNDFMRPILYGAQHPIAVVNDSTKQREYVVVGHNCESGDLLTPAPGNPDKIAIRTLNEADIGDKVLIGGTGAYCAGLRAHGFNSFPSAKEVIIQTCILNFI